MFELFTQKQTLIKSSFFDGVTDYHSHILSGVDDGAHSIEESLAILDYYEKLGVNQGNINSAYYGGYTTRHI